MGRQNLRHFVGLVLVWGLLLGVQNAARAAKVMVWGSNAFAQLGTGDTKVSKVPVAEGVTDVTALAAGGMHSLALKKDGTLWAWGSNQYGQLGHEGSDAAMPVEKKPVPVGGLSDVIAIAAGIQHSMALKKDGTVWAWGRNYTGQLGTGDTNDRKTPVAVDGLSDVMAIAAGGFHSLALKKDGTVWAWGMNREGQLGVKHGDIMDRKAPVQVVGLSDVTAIAAGGAYSLALKKDGTVWAWGKNDKGQLGTSDANSGDTTIACAVVNLSDVTAIAAGCGVEGRGGSHSLALKKDGTVWGWGKNSTGQIGSGTRADSKVPVLVSGLSGIMAVSAGSGHTLALKKDGTLWALGNNYPGSLGDGGAENYSNAPVRVSGLNGVTLIATGGDHCLALVP